MNVSFIVPAYNEELVIARCIRSIHREAYRYSLINPSFSYEITVIDNNSSDRTLEIARDEAANVIVCFQQGVVYARQAGYQNSIYNILANIDADNIVPEGWLDNLKYLEDRDIVCLSGPYRYLNQSSLVQFGVKLFYFFNRLIHHSLPSVLGGNFVVKKTALDRVGGYDTTISFYGEDTSTAKRLSKVGKIKLVPSMWVWADSRRLRNQGLINTVMMYVLNYFSIWLTNKPLHKEYKNYR